MLGRKYRGRFSAVKSGIIKLLKGQKIILNEYVLFLFYIQTLNKIIA